MGRLNAQQGGIDSNEHQPQPDRQGADPAWEAFHPFTFPKKRFQCQSGKRRHIRRCFNRFFHVFLSYSKIHIHPKSKTKAKPPRSPYKPILHRFKQHRSPLTMLQNRDLTQTVFCFFSNNYCLSDVFTAPAVALAGRPSDRFGIMLSNGSAGNRSTLNHGGC